jgi:hypothetical protein
LQTITLINSRCTGIYCACCGIGFPIQQQGGYVEVKQIIVELDREIARLKEARALLAGGSSGGRRRGRPPAKLAAVVKTARQNRLSPEGRKRISEALKRRWASRRKAKGA